MKRLLQFSTEDGQEFFVELNGDNLPHEPVRGFSPEESKRGVIQNAMINFEKSLEPLKAISGSIINSVKDVSGSPDEIEVELGLKFSAKAGIILTTLDGEANLKIILKWNSKGARQI